ncbi:MAG: signal peptidase I [Ruminococcaceae bacterium]|nr:signal peptidase I [Oscillospiraceae bacterium]
MEQQSQAQTNEVKTKPGWNRRKVLTIVTTVALVLAVTLCVVVVSQVLSKGYVSLGGYSMFRVSTGSMEPALPIGTLLISKEVPIAEVQVDDIVNFRAKSSNMLGAVITHRVINIFESNSGEIYLETKGDANSSPDGSYVEQKNLIGIVVYHTSSGNIISVLVSLLSSPVGFFACIVIPCLIFGLLTMRACIGSLRKEMDALTQLEESGEKPDVLKDQLGEKKYQELCDRLRGELLEELKQSADLEETTE